MTGLIVALGLWLLGCLVVTAFIVRGISKLNRDRDR